MLKKLKKDDAIEYVRKRSLRSLDNEALKFAARVDNEMRSNVLETLQKYCLKFNDFNNSEKLIFNRDELRIFWNNTPSTTRQLLERVYSRIFAFAAKQREALRDFESEVCGHTVGLRYQPLQVAGCYAPSGRYPLPSSVLMTVATAKAAGVENIIVTSPRPTDITLAAAYLAGADMVLSAGGAHAIFALAQGCPPYFNRCDAIVGPGNKWVTAAKSLARDRVRIDSLAGPSELLVIAGPTTNPAFVAADLLAQAEHDPDARVFLIGFSENKIKEILGEMSIQIQTLSSREIVQQALNESFYVIVENLEQATQLSNEICPEHLQVNFEITSQQQTGFKNFGAAFFGNSAEVLGDYGLGPNHVLPTSGQARISSGLSVLDFLTTRTFILSNESSRDKSAWQDAAEFASIEGLEAHAQAALLRCQF